MKKIRLSILLLPVVLAACSKPFPIEDALYAEYKAIACKIPTGGVTPEILARQLEINRLFEEKLMADGQPSAEWAAKHALKFAEAVDLKTCDGVQATIQAPSGNAATPGLPAMPAEVAALTGSAALRKFDGVWHFSTEKSRQANPTDDEMAATVVNAALMGVEVATSGSAGMKIQNGHLQDGTSHCTLEPAATPDAPVNCVNNLDRSIYAKLSINERGDLVMATEQINLVLEKR